MGGNAGGAEVLVRSDTDSSNSGTRLAAGPTATASSSVANAAAPTQSMSKQYKNSEAFSSAKRKGANWRDANDEADDSELTKVIEERRIVYVGRIEEGLQLDDLRDKFAGYGPIHQVSIHTKLNG